MDLRTYYSLSLVVIVGFNFITTFASSNLLSKITITSTRASCIKDPLNNKTFIFTYHDNVHVTFADESKVSAGELEIIIDNSGIKKDQNLPSSSVEQTPINNFKKITFKNKVVISNGLRRASAECVHIYLQNQRCLLEGNVKIWQAKQQAKDIPIVATSPRAELNLKTNEFSMLGTIKAPVSTTLILDSNSVFPGKKKSKKDKKLISNDHEKNTTPVTARST